MKSILSIPSIFPKVIHIHFLCLNWQFLYISYMMPSNKHLIMIWLASTREYFIHSIHIVLSIKPKKYQMFSVYFKYWYEKFARALTNSWYVQLYNKCRFHSIPGTTMYGNYVTMLQRICTILSATWCCDVILYR